MKNHTSNLYFAALISLIGAGSLPTKSLADSTPEVVNIGNNGFIMVDRVNVRNGNFAITYGYFSDSKTTPEFPMTYNSKSKDKGLFGIGWGSVFESRLTYMPEGIAVVQENGTGSLTVYGVTDENEMNNEIDKIIASAKAANPNINVDAYKASLKNDRHARYDAVKKYNLGLEFPKEFALPIDNSTIFQNSTCEDSLILREEDNVLRQGCRGQQNLEIFTPQGFVTAKFFPKYDATNYFDYDSENKLKSVTIKDIADNVIGYMKTYITNGYVSKLEAADKYYTFEHDEKGNLTKSIDPNGSDYVFSYDGRGNMTDIKYIDDTHLKITYDNYDKVTSVTQRNGDVTKFEYQTNFDNPHSYSTRATITKDGKTKVTIYKMTD